MGAVRATNNTAEMQALTEAPFWLYTCAEHKGLPSSSKVMTTVDSLCDKGPIDEKLVAKENRNMATLLCQLWKKLKIQIRWVRGHTCDVGNSIADELADLGTRAEAQHRWWKRVQPMGGWEEDVSPQKILSLQRERTPCEQARRIRWTGAVNFPRIKPILQMLTPQLGE